MWKVVQAKTSPPGPHFVAKSGLGWQFWKPKVVLLRRWWPPGPLLVTLPLVLSISFCQKLPLSAKTPFAIKEVPSVTPKVAPWRSAQHHGWRLVWHSKQISSFFGLTRVLHRLLRLFQIFFVRFVHWLTNYHKYGSHKWSAWTTFGPRPFLWQFWLVLFLQHTVLLALGWCCHCYTHMMMSSFYGWNDPVLCVQQWKVCC